jgi:hypothetical protein
LDVLALCVLLLLALRGLASAIDFYEIQIYPIETTAQDHLQVELHSNSVLSATGRLAHEALNPYQIHETLEVTYGLLPHLEVGQYLATARLNAGNYEYAGARTKVHFGVGASENWPIEIGGNIEFDYMRRDAEENPLSFEIRPIVEKRIGGLWLIANLVFDKPFSGPGTHHGVDFSPSGLVSYDLFPWVSPALEYYGDMGPITSLPSVQRQQHFLVPALNLHLMPQLEMNAGVGLGVTDKSHGVFVKSIVGWTF